MQITQAVQIAKLTWDEVRREAEEESSEEEEEEEEVHTDLMEIGPVFSIFSVIFNRKMHKLPLFRAFELEMKGKTGRREVDDHGAYVTAQAICQPPVSCSLSV